MDIGTTFRDDECPTLNKTREEIDTVIVKIMSEKETRQGKYFEVSYDLLIGSLDYIGITSVIQMLPKPFWWTLKIDRVIYDSEFATRDMPKQVDKFC